MLAGLYRGPGREAGGWNSALLYDMIMTQPVVYEFPHLRVPAVLMTGDKDITAIGKDLAPPAVRDSPEDYPTLGRAAADALPDAKLVALPALGHALRFGILQPSAPRPWTRAPERCRPGRYAETRVAPARASALQRSGVHWPSKISILRRRRTPAAPPSD